MNLRKLSHKFSFEILQRKKKKQKIVWNGFTVHEFYYSCVYGNLTLFASLFFPVLSWLKIWARKRGLSKHPKSKCFILFNDSRLNRYTNLTRIQFVHIISNPLKTLKAEHSGFLFLICLEFLRSVQRDSMWWCAQTLKWKMYTSSFHMLWYSKVMGFYTDISFYI